MTSYLIDVNVWLAITWEQHAQHASALRWYSSIDREGLWFCRITMLGMLRLLTNQKVMGDDTMTMAAAWGVYDEWKQDPRVDLVTEPAGIESLFRLATAPLAKLTASNAVSELLPGWLRGGCWRSPGHVRQGSRPDSPIPEGAGRAAGPGVKSR